MVDVEQDDRTDTLVVTCEGEIVAFSILLDDLIHLMMVDLNFHRLGIGSQLLS